METILVHWDEARPWTIYYESKSDKAQGREVSVGVKIIPGVQTIRMDEWEKIKNHPRVKQKIDEGTLKVETSVKKPGEDPQPLTDMPKNLKGKSTKDAIHFISGIMDSVLLKKYRVMEDRVPVKKAIIDQIDKLKAATKETKE